MKKKIILLIVLIGSYIFFEIDTIKSLSREKVLFGIHILFFSLILIFSFACYFFDKKK